MVTPSATGAISAFRPGFCTAASPASTMMLGTNSSDAYLAATASTATGAASRYAGQRNAAVRTTSQAATASRHSAVAS